MMSNTKIHADTRKVLPNPHADCTVRINHSKKMPTPLPKTETNITNIYSKCGPTLREPVETPIVSGVTEKSLNCSYVHFIL